MRYSLLLILLLPIAVEAEWYLMARHGECAPIETLSRKVERMQGLDTPERFIAEMERRGHPVVFERGFSGVTETYSVNIETLGLAILFVQGERCDQFLQPRERTP